jgi:hypothetical protein
MLTAWTYRDYVIKAFNDDKPYDQFIIEQLAADQLPDDKPDDPRRAAMGFLTVGERFRNVNDVINDRIDVVSKGFSGSDGHVRALSRSHVRSDPDEGLLCSARRLRVDL